jgi:RHS repeat-associated protein
MNATHHKSVFTLFFRLPLLLLCFCASIVTAQSQAPFFQPSSAAFTPLTEQPGAPAGSYPLSGFDNVNLFNGHLSFNFPLMQIGGRGHAGYTMMLNIEQHWQVQTVAVPTCDFSGCTYPESNYRYIANPIWWTGIRPGFSPGVLQGRQSGSDAFFSAGCANTIYNKTLTRLTFTAPDGTELELRDQQTGGQPLQGVGCFGGPSRGKVFVSADGSSVTFISDAPISDDRQPNPGVVLSPSGFLLMKDGTRYRIDSGKTSWIQDTNGNRVSFTYAGNNLVGIDDSLNRHVTIAYGNPTIISFKGANGAARTIKVHSASLSTVLRKFPDGSPEYIIKTFGQLFGLQNPQQGTFDIPVTSAVELPDGRLYQFRYDSYANLAQVILPTGGRLEYDWTTGVYPFADHVYGIFKRVIERRTALNTTTSTYETRTTYSNLLNSPANVTVDHLDPKNGNALISRSKHYFYGSPVNNPSAPNLYPGWLDGREYQTESFAANGSTVLRRINHTFQQRSAIPWWTGSAEASPPNDPRLVETTTTLVDTNQVMKVTSIDPNNPTGPVGFDQYNNQTKVWEYDFGSGAPGALLRHTVTSYLTNGYDTLLPNSSSPDIALTAHIRNLPSQVSLFDAAGTERARTTLEYDNYVPDTFHAALFPRSDLSGHDIAWSTGYTKRGNRTALSRFLLPEATALTSYSQYDIAGNAIKVIDPRSTAGNIIATNITYDDNFGTPDGSLAERFTFTELGSQRTFAFPTVITNPLNQSASSQYDYHLGQAINTQDLNGTIAAGYHDDPLDRLTQIRRAYGTGAENQTTIEYDDDDRFVLTKSDLYNVNDNVLVKKQIYDGLGRTIETQQFEGGGNCIRVQTEYDGFGRAFKTSNPFRTWQNETAVWTTQAFDSLGRVISVTTPDNAAATTVYSGNTATVTDPAGKRRKSLTDALGRVVAVYEDPEVPGGPAELDFQTTYMYDVLDNLVRVTQGSQQRFFMYDSLKRLLRSRNPEQGTLASLNLSDPITGNSSWSIGYQYDAGSNLTLKADPRGVISTYTYDVLNRVTTVDYSDTSSINPDVKRFYDGATNGIGYFWYHYTGGDFSTGSNVEHTAIDSYDPLGRPLVKRQLFKLNGAWSTTYQISLSYIRSGRVSTQTYPSGHSVVYNYDSAGRLADKTAVEPAFTGNLGDGVQRTYASGNLYSSLGGLNIERFGTQTPLYHKLQYNIRGQLWDVRVATGPDANGSWNRGALQFFYDGTYGFGTSGPDNNGNVLKSKHYVPLDESSSTWAVHDQTYTYDPLNRLLSTREDFVSSTQPQTPQSLQIYLYDRWGNRRIDPASWGAGINEKDFTVNPTNNHLDVPADQTGVMSYDNAGNLTTDTYSGAGVRTYDAENRMTTAADNMGQTSRYTYNADGNRTRRQVAGGQEQWQIYGFDDELLAEYAANSPASSPKKEYGYRNGQLLVTAEPASAMNVALAVNGAVATASSAWNTVECGSAAGAAIDGDRTGRARCSNRVWNDVAPANTFPDWLQVDFNGSKTITEINVITVQDHLEWPVEPTEAMTFSLYGLTTYQVQYWNNSTWVTIPGGSVSANNKVWRKFTFAAITTTKIRVLATASGDGYSRIVELEAWTGPPPEPRYDLALGATATASTSFPGWGPSAVVNGDRKSLNAYSNGAWSSSAPNNFPEWVQVDFGASKTINEIHVFTLQDNWANSVEPTAAMTFTLYGLTGYEVQYWTASSWVTVPGGSVTGNNKIWRTFTFSPISTSKIRVFSNAAPDGVSRVTEIEAYGPASGSGNGVRWLVPDHLGTPRIVLDQTGSLAGVTRHDYLPFGEELFADTGGRTPSMGYQGDGIRQQFTSKERDFETGLDYSLARYYSLTQGRFTSLDPLNASGHSIVPQSWNRYSYVLNNPLKLTDPDGEMWIYHYLDSHHTRIGIAWIDGKRIPKDLQAKGYQALNFGGEKSKEISLTDGSVVRLRANSGRHEVLREAQSGGDGGYVNSGLVRELARQTAPLPKATAFFIVASVAGGYNIAMVGGPLVIADSAAFALATLKNVQNGGGGDAEMMGNISSLYDDSRTRPGSIRNVDTDVSKADFIKNLQDAGYKMTKSGNATILDNGVYRYALYDVATSTGGNTAAFSRAGQGQSLKIRLK